ASWAEGDPGKASSTTQQGRIEENAKTATRGAAAERDNARPQAQTASAFASQLAARAFASSSTTNEQMRLDNPLANQDPTGRGVPDKADPAATSGTGQSAGAGSGVAGQGGAVGGGVGQTGPGARGPDD